MLLIITICCYCCITQSFCMNSNAVNASGYFTIFLLLTAIAPSTVRAEEDEVVYAVFGEKVALHCNLKFAKPTPHITWFDFVHNENEHPAQIYDGTKVLDSHKNKANFAVDEYFSLTISHLSGEQAGQYFCVSQLNNTYSLKHYYQLVLVGV